MSSEYRLNIYAPLAEGGALVAQIDGTSYRGLGYARVVNAPGVCAFGVHAAHAAAGYLVDDAIVDVWRRNVAAGIEWYVDWTGMIRQITRTYDNGHDAMEVMAAGALGLLGRRVVAWYTNTSNRSAFDGVPAETIAKLLVNYNAGAAATIGNSRLRTGTITGVSVQADGAQGNSLSLACAYDNLLATLQEISAERGGGGDFDLIRTDDAAFEFRWYDGQRGDDRTGEVVFALGYGNMAAPVYAENRFDLKTVALVGGQGQETGRAVAVRTGDEYLAGRDIEVFLDGRNEAETAALNTKGDKVLTAARNAVSEMRFDVIQTPGCLYGRDYFLGDLVSWQYAELSGEMKVQGVTVAVNDDGQEQINVTMADVA